MRLGLLAHSSVSGRPALIQCATGTPEDPNAALGELFDLFSREENSERVVEVQKSRPNLNYHTEINIPKNREKNYQCEKFISNFFSRNSGGLFETVNAHMAAFM